VIKINDARFSYDESRGDAIADLTLHVAEGDFLGVIGSSGAGKSTLTRMINGLVPHHYGGTFRGEVTVDGMPTRSFCPEELARSVGSVFQDIEGQLLASVVEDEILFGLENFGVRRDEIEGRMQYALAATGISDLRGRTISTLSGGQKQKVVIAAITALKPKIMVLDEPTGELDPQSSRRVFETLRELNAKQGVTIVIVEQKIMLLCEFASRLAVMDRGRMTLEGPVKDVLKSAERLEEAGVNIPRVTTLARRLRECRLYDGEAPVNIPDASEMMRTALHASL
jgi:energy-coupling factor transport system ATP-binding protein